MSVHLHGAAFFMGKELLVLIGDEFGIDPESAWMLWRREGCPSLPEIESQFHSFPAHSIVTVVTELSWLSC
jgi:hypothetical protein